MCSKLRTVAASNNRDHAPRSRHIYIGVVLRAHSVRAKARIQRNASGEVATPSNWHIVFRPKIPVHSQQAD